MPIVIVTHDIGLSRGNTAGTGNTLLAEALGDALGFVPHGTPILAQQGVALAARDLGIPVAYTIQPPTDNTPLDRSTMEWNSKTVIDMQIAWLNAHDRWPALLLVLTWPDHMPRVQWLMERAGCANMLPLPLRSYQAKNYFDRHALYAPMRWAARTFGGTLIFRAYEVLVRLLFKRKGLL
jgi:hypothetical protein